MISEKENEKISKFLSLVLRHRPDAIGIEVEKDGWTDVKNLIEKLKSKDIHLDLQILKYIVSSNSKSRFAFNDTMDKIRASQGHSIQVELEYEPQVPPKILFHGTATKFSDSILAIGLIKGKRNHVHLSSDIETAISVGKRHGNPFVFQVQSKEMHEAKYSFYQSDNGIWLTNDVPSKYLMPIILP